MSTLSDKLIGWFSPKAAAQRAAYRRQMRILEGGKVRKYDGASQGRRAGNWSSGSTSADAEISRDGRTLRDRANDLIRNNPDAARIVQVHADHIAGITPRFTGRNDKATQNLTDLWRWFSDSCHPEGSMNFDGMQYQAVRIMVGSGNQLIRKRNRKPTDGLKVPLQMQPLEIDYLDTGRRRDQSSKNKIVNGIEFDLIGGRRGYYLFAEHPGDRSGLFSRDSKFVRASDLCHLFEPQRQQSIGVTWLAPVMMDLRDVQEYRQAELFRKKLESCHVGVVTMDDEEADMDDPERLVGLDDSEGEATDSGYVDRLEDAYGNIVDRFEPGMWIYGKRGQKVEFNDPSVSAGHEAYLRSQYYRIAAGVRMPYELAFGDYSQTNFASGKLGILAYRRFVRAIQKNYLMPQFCYPIERWFREAIIASGAVGADEKFSITWQLPKFEPLDPLGQTRTDILDVRAGFRSPQDIIKSRGGDSEKTRQEILDWHTWADTNKLAFDIDPRRVSINGQAQFTDPTSEEK